ncbi:MAG: ribonuclease III [Rhodospirillales bacterium]
MTRGRKRQPDPLAPLEKALGHRFADRKLLALALTHSSAGQHRLDDNQRLEFLGDRVLGLAVADILLSRFPEEEEGALAKRFAQLTRREALAQVARAIELGPHLNVAGGGREPRGFESRERDAEGTLADACEAAIAALYLDGGLKAAQRFVARAWEGLIAADDRPPRDPKTALQEWAQARGQPLPKYSVVAREGPDHQPLFTVTVALRDGGAATATGQTKRAAEQAAASDLLRRLEGAP